MSTPLVSVVIPVYNREYSVKRAVDSVLAQTFKDIEVIVVDDGSKDKSVEILKSYGDAIRLICQPNGGAGKARNAGIRAARGKWIAFQDSDDEWRPEKLECQLRLVEKYGARVCYSRCVDETGVLMPDLENVKSTLKEPGVYWVDDPVEFLSSSPTHPYLQSMLVERALFEATGFFETTLHTAEDTLWLYKLSFLGGGLYVDRPMTVIYRYSDNSLTYDVRPESAEKRYDAMMRMQDELYARLRLVRPGESKIMRGRLAFHMGSRAELACAAGDFLLARSLAKDGMWFAGDRKTFLRCAAIWLAPALCRGKFRKKWNYR